MREERSECDRSWNTHTKCACAPKPQEIHHASLARRWAALVSCITTTPVFSLLLSLLCLYGIMSYLVPPAACHGLCTRIFLVSFINSSREYLLVYYTKYILRTNFVTAATRSFLSCLYELTTLNNNKTERNFPFSS